MPRLVVDGDSSEEFTVNLSTSLFYARPNSLESLLLTFSCRFANVRLMSLLSSHTSPSPSSTWSSSSSFLALQISWIHPSTGRLRTYFFGARLLCQALVSPKVAGADRWRRREGRVSTSTKIALEWICRLLSDHFPDVFNGIWVHLVHRLSHGPVRMTFFISPHTDTRYDLCRTSTLKRLFWSEGPGFKQSLSEGLSGCYFEEHRTRLWV